MRRHSPSRFHERFRKCRLAEPRLRHRRMPLSQGLISGFALSNATLSRRGLRRGNGKERAAARVRNRHRKTKIPETVADAVSGIPTNIRVARITMPEEITLRNFRSSRQLVRRNLSAVLQNQRHWPAGPFTRDFSTYTPGEICSVLSDVSFNAVAALTSRIVLGDLTIVNDNETYPRYLGPQWLYRMPSPEVVGRKNADNAWGTAITHLRRAGVQLGSRTKLYLRGAGYVSARYAQALPYQKSASSTSLITGGLEGNSIALAGHPKDFSCLGLTALFCDATHIEIFSSMRRLRGRQDSLLPASATNVVQVACARQFESDWRRAATRLAPRRTPIWTDFPAGRALDWAQWSAIQERADALEDKLKFATSGERAALAEVIRRGA